MQCTGRKAPKPTSKTLKDSKHHQKLTIDGAEGFQIYRSLKEVGDGGEWEGVVVEEDFNQIQQIRNLG